MIAVVTDVTFIVMVISLTKHSTVPVVATVSNVHNLLFKTVCAFTIYHLPSTSYTFRQRHPVTVLNYLILPYLLA
jgi:hypothetical protein